MNWKPLTNVNSNNNLKNSSNKKKDDDKRSPNDKKDDLTNTINTKGPPPGVDIEIKIKAMLILRGRGKCGYCGWKGHNALKCFYLVDNPLEGWIPKLDMWCYLKAKST